jgi:hypothetical protein
MLSQIVTYCFKTQANTYAINTKTLVVGILKHCDIRKGGEGNVQTEYSDNKISSRLNKRMMEITFNSDTEKIVLDTIKQQDKLWRTGTGKHITIILHNSIKYTGELIVVRRGSLIINYGEEEIEYMSVLSQLPFIVINRNDIDTILLFDRTSSLGRIITGAICGAVFGGAINYFFGYERYKNRHLSITIYATIFAAICGATIGWGIIENSEYINKEGGDALLIMYSRYANGEPPYIQQIYPQ